MSAKPSPRTLLLAQSITTFFISLVMSGLMGAMNKGVNLNWLMSWPRDWIVVWPVVFILVRAFGPLGLKMAAAIERRRLAP